MSKCLFLSDLFSNEGKTVFIVYYFHRKLSAIQSFGEKTSAEESYMGNVTRNANMRS